MAGPARDWWRVVEEKLRGEGMHQEWNTFLEEFRKKFIPMVIRDRKKQEFIYLRQRNLTVPQYEVEFTKLAKYTLDMVNTDDKE